MILFGSCLKGRFVIDTVFVVAGGEAYDRRTYRSLDVSDAYRDVALRPVFAASGPEKSCGSRADAERQYVLYRGATLDRLADGMFSFFPSVPASDEPGFPRPAIKLSEYVTDNHKQGIRRSAPLAVETVRRVWAEVVRQVLGAGLWLGVEAEMPERRNAVKRVATAGSTTRRC